MSDETSQTRVLPDGPAGELPPGATLNAGMYRISKRIAAGGFGITYEARDNLDRRVAIKECFPAGLALRAGDFTVSAASASTAEPFETARNLFLREARTLAILRHPNIVHVQTLFEENGTAYMAMDYIDGRDLQEVIERNPELLTPTYILELTRTLLAAMDYLHREVPAIGKERLLHRDIKPANIRIDELNNPVIIDFGAARQETRNKSRVAGSFRVVSDGYSPNEFYVAGTEQGPASDLYSVAATLHHAIAGNAPPPADERAQKVSNGEDDPYQPIAGRFPGHDPRLLGLIDRALARPLKDRPADAAAWMAAIADGGTRIVSQDDGPETPPVLPAPPAPPPAKRGGGMVLGAVLGAGVIAALGGGAMALGLLPMPGGTSTDAALREQLQQAQTALEQVQGDLDSSETQLADVMAARDLAQARAEELNDSVSRLRDEIAALTEGDGPDAAELRMRLNEALAERTRLNALVQVLNANLEEAEAAAEADIAALEDQIAALEEQGGGTDALRAERDAAIAARDAAIAARDEARDLAERAQSDLARMAANLDEAESEATRLLFELRQSEQRLSRMLAGEATPNPAPNPSPNQRSGNCPTPGPAQATVAYSGTDIYTPRTHDVVAGGNIDLGGCADLPVNARGFTIRGPDFTFELSDMEQFDRMEVSVTSEIDNCDPVLLAQSADGVWHFNDDANGGLLPRLEFAGSASSDGPLHVWVGTFDGVACDSTLHINSWLF